MEKLAEMIEKLEDALYSQMAGGIEQIDTEEFGKVADILKDLASTKKNCLKAEYYETVTEAMEAEGAESEEGAEGEERKYYGGRRRDSRGRFMRRRGYVEMPEYMEDYDMDAEQYNKLRDMDKDMSRMYYTDMQNRSRYYTQNGGNGGNSGGSNGGNMRNYTEGRSGMSRRGYIETKETHNSGSESDKMINRRELEKWVDDIGQDVKELVPTMSAEERTSLKTKMTNLVNAL